ncbi:hypothetical protein FNF27_01401 [Cafeteria roenbergensis]|uniref:Lysosomal dipeptide transporter MFSD1 n=2 Tax=Cafeteria roenbergensis TaxID=33653 RepID=A0A5A8CC39_CAFRO|nr:hypothetical protein FNF29_05802 [Cafeteria roenbergensis]KAA0152283.1 hypothetical protein FNF31_06658 [Cafeteria roenbergensis]KAA0172185.1 hypothetical protein FNF28_00188 [Cafeteria roenbergensis]KAA0177071.1 hypothetical protein FNF27_01401 [Cafeteria roenbergensis]|eukprot:KAA0149590.1 hypothetical protein FNF29_05802 [Cafeteria roenbergensis]
MGTRKPEETGAPSWKAWRWVALTLSCLVLLGPYAAFDNPAATNPQLREHMRDQGLNAGSTFDESYALLYTVYSIPNTVLPLLGGAMTDRLSPRVMLVALSVTQFAGQCIFAIGTGLRSWDTMLGGRVVFGLGGEVLTVVNSFLVSRWFAGAELGTALAIIVGFGRGCSVLNDGVSPLFTDPTDAYWLSAGLCAVSCCAAVGVALLDGKRVQSAGMAEHSDEVAGEVPLADHAESGEGVAAPRPGGAAPSPGCLASGQAMLRSAIAALGSFTTAFWVLSAAFVIGAASISSYNNVATDYLKFRWGIRQPDADSSQRRGLTLGIIYLVSAVTAPMAGALVDRFGRRWPLMLAGMVIAACSHALLGLPPLWAVPVEVTHALLGVAYALFASSNWSLVPLLVPPKLGGSSYGVATALQNIGLAIFPLAVSALQPRSGGAQGACSGLVASLGGEWGYTCTEALLLAMAAASAAATAALGCLEAAAVRSCAERLDDADPPKDKGGASAPLLINGE